MWKKTEKGLIIIQQKHYLDIERLKPNYLDAFSEGDEIVIQEKIDGANFQFVTMPKVIASKHLVVERNWTKPTL